MSNFEYDLHFNGEGDGVPDQKMIVLSVPASVGDILDIGNVREFKIVAIFHYGGDKRSQLVLDYE